MASFTKAIAAGNAYAQIGFIDSNGFLVGSATSAPANGAVGSGLLDITGIKTAAPAVPDPEFVQVTGDDVLLGEAGVGNLFGRQSGGDDAHDLAAPRQHRVGQRAHQPDAPAAVDQPQAPPGQRLAQRLRRRAVHVALARTRPAEHRHALHDPLLFTLYASRFMPHPLLLSSKT